MPGTSTLARQFVAILWIAALAGQSLLPLAHLSHHNLAVTCRTSQRLRDARPLATSLPASSQSRVELLCPICSAIASSPRDFAATKLALNLVSLRAVPSACLRLCLPAVSPLRSRSDLSDATPRAPPA